MESKDKKEKINKDGSITLTSQDGKYSVTYRTNENGNFSDEWEDFTEYDDLY